MRLLSLILTLAIAGCAASNIDPSHAVSESKQSGVASGSITYAGAYGAYILHVVEQSTGKSYRIQHGSSQALNPMLAFRGEPLHTRLGAAGSPFAVELPVGTYALRAWQVSVGASNIGSAHPTGVSFKVEPGQAIYLGNFHFRETASIGRLPTAATLTLLDRSTRDVPAIRGQFPALANVPLTQGIRPEARYEEIGGRGTGTITLPIFIPVGR